MTSTTYEQPKFDVNAEYKRLIENNLEMYNRDFISSTAARKAAKKIRQWRAANSHRQFDTNA